MVLTGKHERLLDNKNRLSLPKRVRETMQIGPRDALYSAIHRRPCLLLYALGDLQKVGTIWESKAASYEQALEQYLSFFPELVELTIDRQGRVLLVEDLVRGAGLSREVVLLGVKDHLEVWDRARWLEYRNSRLQAPWIGSGLSAVPLV